MSAVQLQPKPSANRFCRALRPPLLVAHAGTQSTARGVSVKIPRSRWTLSLQIQRSRLVRSSQIERTGPVTDKENGPTVTLKENSDFKMRIRFPNLRTMTLCWHIPKRVPKTNYVVLLNLLNSL